MSFLNRLAAKAKDPMGGAPLKLAFLGDSVTHGCFELIRRENGRIDTVFDYEAVYHNQLRRLFERAFLNVPVSAVNAGISGDTAQGGLARLERDVLACRPDLAVVCFGLNDVLRGSGYRAVYLDALRGCFQALREAGVPVVFMTPNMMNTYVSLDVPEGELRQMAEVTADAQNSGRMDGFMEEARRVCAEEGVVLCDCYAHWKRLHALGADVTLLLSNRLNHPTREMHRLFAEDLYRVILREGL